MALLSVPLMAQGEGVSDSLCLAGVFEPGAPACSTNDVLISQFVLVGPPQTCQADSWREVELEIRIESGVDRYDIGLWINQLGGSARTDESFNCFHDALMPLANPASACNHGSQDPDLLAYYDLDGDACGDVHSPVDNPCGNAVVEPCSGGGGSCLVTRRIAQLGLLCRDSDGDDVVDVSACASWDINESTQCTTVQEAYPGTGSRCSCNEGIPVQNLFVSTPEELLFLDGFEDAE